MLHIGTADLGWVHLPVSTEVYQYGNPAAWTASFRRLLRSQIGKVGTPLGITPCTCTGRLCPRERPRLRQCHLNLRSSVTSLPPYYVEKDNGQRDQRSTEAEAPRIIQYVVTGTIRNLWLTPLPQTTAPGGESDTALNSCSDTQLGHTPYTFLPSV